MQRVSLEQCTNRTNTHHRMHRCQLSVAPPTRVCMQQTQNAPSQHWAARQRTRACIYLPDWPDPAIGTAATHRGCIKSFRTPRASGCDKFRTLSPPHTYLYKSIDRSFCYVKVSRTKKSSLVHRSTSIYQEQYNTHCTGMEA